ncbi:MAG: hypothetical protein QUS33_04710 [Dehalococcoidia bacterium]|nr:hypothetical protein [Dehalococcoidia bacterium]
MPTLAPIQVLHHAIVDMTMGGAGWSDEDGETPPGFMRPIAGGRIYVHVSPEATAEFSASTLPLLWKVARSISWPTLIVAQALLAQWATLTTSRDQAVTISLDRILDYRGLKRIRRAGEPSGWHHGHRTKDRMVVAHQISILGQLFFSAYNLRAYPDRCREKSIPRLTFHNTQFIVVTDTWGQLGLMPGETKKPYPTHIRYIPGAWMEEFAKAGLTQFGRFLSRNRSYDPYRQEWELAMSAWLTLEVFPNNAGGGRVIHRAIETILHSIGQRVDSRHPGRTRHRFELMMESMVADGYLSEWSYVADNTYSDRTWLPSWLKAKVSFRPSKSYDEYYSRRNPRRRSKQTPKNRRTDASS